MTLIEKFFKTKICNGVLNFCVLSLLLSSCSLLKIESEQKPLGVIDLNTRLLTQGFAEIAMERVEKAADSISKLSEHEKSIQLNTLQWKIQTSEELGKISFQTEPRIALLDTWSYFLEVKNALEDPNLAVLFKEHNPIALAAIEENIEDIEKIAASVLSKNEFPIIKGFVKDYVNTTPLLMQKDFKHQSIRNSYLKFKKIPDSIAVQTVGTLSEVVADASNRFGYWSSASGKRFNWKTEMLLKEKGLDSIVLEAKIAEFEEQLDRLLEVAENSPETIEDAIIEFRNRISPLFRNLNYEIGSAMQSLSSDVQSIDAMLLRERVALDSIIKRERLALTAKADTLVATGIDNAFKGISRTIRNLIVYFILLFVVVLGLPFYLGYLTGKRKFK